MILNVLEYLECSAERYPEKTVYADENKEYSYLQFMTKAKALGSELARKYGKVNSPMAVMTSKTVDSLLCFFSVLYSGNYYVPVDVEMPKERQEYIFDTIKPVAVLNPEEMTFEYEIDEALLKSQRSKVLDIDPCYAIFTSGSTGMPKGIVIAHRSVIDFTDWFAKAGEFSDKDIFGNQAPFYFDLSVKDIYQTLKNGATCYIIPKKLFMFPNMIVDFLNEKKVTALVWATSAFHLLANSKVFEKKTLDTVRTVILGGEALRSKQLNIWRKAMPNIRYINLYGPTEVTVDCTWYPIEKEFSDDESIPIGYPCANKEVFLLNEEGKPCKIGEPGEICVRGTGLARGYVNDPEKTSKAFIQDPRQSAYPETIYKTGDLAVQNEDGSFSFLTRKDGQIKHMSYRIELGEIEVNLTAIPQVEELMCFFEEERDKIHCAYTGSIDFNDLAKMARERLPKYMVPNVYHMLSEMPHNANGKIDRVKIKKEMLEAKDE